MDAMANQITSLTIVYSTVYSGIDQRKHQSSTSLAFVWGIHRWPVNSPQKWPLTGKMFPFDDVIMLFTNKVGSLCFLLSYIKKNSCRWWYCEDDNNIPSKNTKNVFQCILACRKHLSNTTSITVDLCMHEKLDDTADSHKQRNEIKI